MRGCRRLKEFQREKRQQWVSSAGTHYGRHFFCTRNVCVVPPAATSRSHEVARHAMRLLRKNYWGLGTFGLKVAPCLLKRTELGILDGQLERGSFTVQRRRPWHAGRRHGAEL